MPVDLTSKVSSPSRYATSRIAVGAISLPKLPHHDKAETTTKIYIHPTFAVALLDEYSNVTTFSQLSTVPRCVSQ